MKLGGMHTTMDVQASISKVYKDGGLLALLICSSVLAEAIAKHVGKEKKVSDGYQGCKIAFEALFRLFHDALKSWPQQFKKKK